MGWGTSESHCRGGKRDSHRGDSQKKIGVQKNKQYVKEHAVEASERGIAGAFQEFFAPTVKECSKTELSRKSMGYTHSCCFYRIANIHHFV